MAKRQKVENVNVKEKEEGTVLVGVTISEKQYILMKEVGDIYGITVTAIMRMCNATALPILLDMFDRLSKHTLQLQNYAASLSINLDPVNKQDVEKTFAEIQTRIERRNVTTNTAIKKLQQQGVLPKNDGRFEYEPAADDPTPVGPVNKILCDELGDSMQQPIFWKKMGIPEPTDPIEEPKKTDEIDDIFLQFNN